MSNLPFKNNPDSYFPTSSASTRNRKVLSTYTVRSLGQNIHTLSVGDYHPLFSPRLRCRCQAQHHAPVKAILDMSTFFSFPLASCRDLAQHIPDSVYQGILGLKKCSRIRKPILSRDINKDPLYASKVSKTCAQVAVFRGSTATCHDIYRGLR